MQLQVEKRSSPRIAANFTARLFPDDIKGNVLNISETGICFDCERSALPEDILLSMDLSPLRSKQPTKTPARVVWRNNLTENRSQLGVQFSSLDRGHLSQLRDFIFDKFAKKASAIIKDTDEDLKIKVEDFFNKDIKQYHENLS